MLWALPMAVLLAASIQDEIDRASPGGTVRLAPGVYHEHVTISRPLVLDGGGEVVIDGGGAGTVVRVSSPGVTLRGLTVRASGDSFTQEDSAVRIEDADGCVVERCRLEDVLFGLYVAKANRCAFRDLWIGGKPLEMPRRGDGVRLWYSDDTVLERVRLVDSRDFVIWFARRTVVRGCRVEGGRYGLHYMYCDDNLFEDNVFAGNQVGGAIMYSRRIQLRGNRFESSRGPSAYGLLLKDADDIESRGNVYLDNTRGLFFDNSPQSQDAACVISGDLFAGNDAGVSILPSTRRVRFEGNAFVDNLVHVEVDGHSEAAKNTWSGNYWSGVPTYDEDRDGYGDVPYRPQSVYEDLVRRHPSLGLLRQSPSVAAIELAGNLFPVTPGEALLEDPRPAVNPKLPQVHSDERPRSGLLPYVAGVLVLVPLAAARGARRVFK